MLIYISFYEALFSIYLADLKFFKIIIPVLEFT